MYETVELKKPYKKVEDVHMVEYATLQNLDSKRHTESSPEPPPIPAYAEDLLSEPGQSKMNLYSPILICPYTYSYLATTHPPNNPPTRPTNRLLIPLYKNPAYVLRILLGIFCTQFARMQNTINLTKNWA